MTVPRINLTIKPTLGAALCHLVAPRINELSRATHGHVSGIIHTHLTSTMRQIKAIHCEEVLGPICQPTCDRQRRDQQHNNVKGPRENQETEAIAEWKTAHQQCSTDLP